jgi:hypothetical protein
VVGSGAAAMSKEVEEESDEPDATCEISPPPLLLRSSRHPTKRKRIVRTKIERFNNFLISLSSS